jgi:glycosyltransferase involved in cell wall biosynthesis
MDNRYVLLTAAKNEAACIGEVIQLVVRQTVLPMVWIIVDDGSSDQTAAIVESFASKFPFIRLQSSGSREGRNFGSQYKALQAAYEMARPLEFDFVAVQDADQGPESANYYGSILDEFNREPRLGVASGVVYERPHGKWEVRKDNAQDSVAASAVFRRTSFEQVGGYTPLYYGGSDWLIQLLVTMKGWELLTRPDLHILHYRLTSSAGGIWRGKFRSGMENACFGSHPLFQILKCCRRLKSPPFFVGSVGMYAGYLWWHLSGRKPLLKPEEVAYLRKQQVNKMRKWFRNLLASTRPSA